MRASVLIASLCALATLVLAAAPVRAAPAPPSWLRDLQHAGCYRPGQMTLREGPHPALAFVDYCSKAPRPPGASALTLVFVDLETGVARVIRIPDYNVGGLGFGPDGVLRWTGIGSATEWSGPWIIRAAEYRDGEATSRDLGSISMSNMSWPNQMQGDGCRLATWRDANDTRAPTFGRILAEGVQLQDGVAITGAPRFWWPPAHAFVLRQANGDYVTADCHGVLGRPDPALSDQLNRFDRPDLVYRTLPGWRTFIATGSSGAVVLSMDGPGRRLGPYNLRSTLVVSPMDVTDGPPEADELEWVALLPGERFVGRVGADCLRLYDGRTGDELGQQCSKTLSKLFPTTFGGGRLMTFDIKRGLQPVDLDMTAFHR